MAPLSRGAINDPLTTQRMPAQMRGRSALHIPFGRWQALERRTPVKQSFAPIGFDMTMNEKAHECSAVHFFDGLRRTETGNQIDDFNTATI